MDLTVGCIRKKITNDCVKIKQLRENFMNLNDMFRIFKVLAINF